jgi:hypothetical protein
MREPMHRVMERVRQGLHLEDLAEGGSRLRSVGKRLRQVRSHAQELHGRLFSLTPRPKPSLRPLQIAAAIHRFS